jgi:hypothetical protein
MLAPRPTKLRSQRDINLWRIPLQLSLTAVAAGRAPMSGPGEGIGAEPDDAAILQQAETGAVVSCPKSGYLQHVDHVRWSRPRAQRTH